MEQGLTSTASAKPGRLFARPDRARGARQASQQAHAPHTSSLSCLTSLDRQVSSAKTASTQLATYAIVPRGTRRGWAVKGARSRIEATAQVKTQQASPAEALSGGPALFDRRAPRNLAGLHAGTRRRDAPQCNVPSTTQAPAGDGHSGGTSVGGALEPARAWVTTRRETHCAQKIRRAQALALELPTNSFL